MIQSHGLEAAAPCQRQPTKPAQGLNMRAARELNTSFKKKNKYYIQVIKRVYGDTVDSLRLDCACS